MGLDSFWQETEPSAPKLENVSLCGGMFSVVDGDSFRGKVYANLIERVTGVSLYQQRIENAQVQEMAQKLREFLNEHQDRLVYDECQRCFGPDEVKNLVLMFEHHAQYGSVLLGWW
jgi:hypothetical protein